MSGELNDLNITAFKSKVKYSLKFKAYIKSKVKWYLKWKIKC